MRYAIVAVLFLGLTTNSATAQGWAEKMFKETTHDFGVVPMGTQLFYRFSITNIYAVRMEITGITPGCGCVTATAAKRVLEPRESTTLDVTMDASRFRGAKSVGIRVTVGPEFTSSAELRVTANSRGDIVFNPGQIQFGQVARGQSPKMVMRVEYAGTQAWQVTEVEVPKNLPIDVTTTEDYRQGGKVGYKIEATLRGEAPAGSFKEFIFLKTNDPNAAVVPILVEANVIAALSVTPSPLNLGTVKVGERLTGRVVVKGIKAFLIKEVSGVDLEGGSIVLGTTTTTSSPLQILTFTCKFDKPGEVKREIKIKTDLQEAPLSVTIEAVVVAP